MIKQIVNFQFPLWDTEVEYIPEPIKGKELSIPFMGYWILQRMSVKERPIFQFPLWDTLKSENLIKKFYNILSIPFMGYFFNPIVSLYKFFSFNSLYGILL